jgi:predicted nucleic-acid-binding protein
MLGADTTILIRQPMRYQTNRASALQGIIKSRRRPPVAILEMTEAVAEGAAGAALRATSMIGLDTNILVRYLTQDDPIQSPRRRRSSNAD